VLVFNPSDWCGRYSVGTQSAWLVQKLQCWYAVGLVGTKFIVLVRNPSGWYGRYGVGAKSVCLARKL
jgi:hypothetical protein